MVLLECCLELFKRNCRSCRELRPETRSQTTGLSSGSESYSCPNTSWLLHPGQIRTLRLLNIQLRQLARVIFGVILAQLLDILLGRLPQVLHIELSLLILLVSYPCILYSDLFDPLLSQPLLSLLLFIPIFFHLRTFSLFLLL